jgi:hypothetical protein
MTLNIGLKHKHQHIDIQAGISICLRRIGGFTSVRVLVGKFRSFEACNKALIAEQEQKEITRMAAIARNHNGCTGNTKRL